jgi:hypothetical protein
MLLRTVLTLVAALAFSLFAGAATAATRCQCEDGSIMRARADDASDAECDKVCEDFGGGRRWVSEVESQETSSSSVEDVGDSGDDSSVVRRTRADGSPVDDGANIPHIEQIP